MNAVSRLRVRRRERAAKADAVAQLIESLDREPGAWLGCDVNAEALFARASMGVTDPALAFVLDGDVLQVRALRPLGRLLLPRLSHFARPDGNAEDTCLSVPVSNGSPHTVLGVLRAFLRIFEASGPALALFGAWSFDYFRLGPDQVIPQDRRRRLVLYFSDRVLVDDADGSRWVEFDFPDLDLAQGAGVFLPLPPSDGIGPSSDASPGEHAARVARGVDLLRNGALASLVLSRRYVCDIEVAPSVAFGQLRAHNPYPAMFALNLGGGEHLFGASPDLQVRADGLWIESAPVCGTLRRGADPVEDAERSTSLLGSSKEAAALSVCADSDLNDKAQVSIPGTSELVSHRRLHYFNTILHTVDHTRARRRADCDAFDVLLAHATPATVTGTPKLDAVAAIEALESGWRNWYGGTVARIGSDDSLEAYTVLRAARVVGAVAEVRTGGNLMVDSDPLDEVAETELKAQTLFRVLRGESPSAPRTARVAASRPCLQVRVINLGDPWLSRSLDLLSRIGVEAYSGADVLLLLGGFQPVDSLVVQHSIRGARATIAVAGAALGLLCASGAMIARFDAPRFARATRILPSPDGFLAMQQTDQVGLYSAHGVRSDLLPAQWQLSGHDGKGWALAAESSGQASIALLFRPESALSLPGGTGECVLRTALEHLAD